MFGPLHITMIVVSLVICVLVTILFTKMSFKNILRTLLICCIVSEFIKIFGYIIRNLDKLGGYLPKTDLPFHLCSIQIIFIIILNVSKNEKFKKIILSFMLPSCLIGAFAAIMIPASTPISSFSMITIQYFPYHAILMSFAIYLYISKEITFTLRDYYTSIAMLFVVFFIAIYINSILYDGVSNINFMYVVNPPVDNLPILNKENGWVSYIIRYSIICLFAVSMCYIPTFIKEIKNRKKAKEEVIVS